MLMLLDREVPPGAARQLSLSLCRYKVLVAGLLVLVRYSMNQDEIARQLNQVMVDLLVQDGHIKTPAIERAFREIFRHRFLPNEISVADIYQDKTIILKESSSEGPLECGLPISSSTMPGLLASILGAADIRPGYLAALIGNLVEASGEVITMEIDADIAIQAQEKFSVLGYQNIRCIASDGSTGYPAKAPYQRIIITASCADVPEAWKQQIDRNGFLVLPLSLSQRASLYPMMVFEKIGDQLIGKVASNLVTVGFIPMYGDHVSYRVQYDKTITKLESAIFRNIRSQLAFADNKSITLIALLEIASAIESGPDRIESIEAKAIYDQTINKWQQLKKPKVEDFEFHLLANNQLLRDHNWHFNKENHTLFVRVLS